MWKRIRDWIEVRIGLDELVRTQLRDYRVPENINIFYTLGFVAMVAYMIQAVTGFFLLVYYVPHSEHAFRSIQDIMTRVPYGWLFRQMHVMGGNLIVIVLILHLFSVLFTGSYKKPRELTWTSGGLMLATVFLFCLSGFLLPWSQLSYWSTTIVTTMPAAFPYVGDFVANVLRGGDHISGSTLNRFFALHVALLPPILVTLLAFHLFLIRRIGISSPPFGETVEENSPWVGYKHEQYHGQPFYPGFFLKEIFMVMIYLAVMFFFITFTPTFFASGDANIQADTLRTPVHSRPEWYFLAPYQMLKLIPNKFFGIGVQVIFVLLFLLWPFIDTKAEKNVLKRPFLLSVILCCMVLWVVLTIWGAY
ncbi:MAG: cytochrome bc complex cytochrome b subunit [Nitrospirae bacterium]|nr:cytochrome bc complex cytochrome b subunit [Nitrospirota bacterium]